MAAQELPERLKQLRSRVAKLKDSVEASWHSTYEGSPSIAPAAAPLALSSNIGAAFKDFEADASENGADAAPSAFSALNAVLQRLQTVTGLPNVGCYGSIPPEHLEGKSAEEGAPLFVSHSDVAILTRLVSHIAERKHVHRSSSGQVLKANLERQFSDHQEVFDKATREYVLGITAKQTPLQKLRAVGQRIRARQLRKGRGSIKNLLEGLSLTNVANLKALQVVQGIDKWDFDIFAARDEVAAILKSSSDSEEPGVVPGTVDTFVAVAMTAFTRLACVVPLGINPKVLRSYVCAVGQKYNGVPYHNALHAADVTQSMFYFLNQRLAQHTTLAQQFASVWAALAHDLGHPAVTNMFLVLSEHPLATRYNDKSVLENFHVASAFEILKQPGNNLLKHVNNVIKQEVRKLVVEMILATDNAVHGQVCASLSERLEVAGAQPFNLKEKAKDAQLVLSVVLHTADVSNPAKEWGMYMRWTDLIITEFFNQGDREKELGLPVISINDRENPIPLENMQAGFIRGLVLPLYTKVDSIAVVDCEEPLAQLNANLKVWEDRIHAKAAAAPGAGTGAGSAAPPSPDSGTPPAPPSSPPRDDGSGSGTPPPPPPERAELARCGAARDGYDNDKL